MTSSQYFADRLYILGGIIRPVVSEILTTGHVIPPGIYSLSAKY
jgi:hypothetical protein